MLAAVEGFSLLRADPADELLQLLLFLLVGAGKEVPPHVLCVILLSSQDGSPFLQVIGSWCFSYCQTVKFAAVRPIAGDDLVLTLL